MRILFVAIPNSVHTARWISQLAGQGHDLHLFPSVATRPHRSLRNVTLHFCGLGAWAVSRIAWGISKEFRLAEQKHRGMLLRALPDRSFWLAWVIRCVRPDVVQSLETQHAGYLTLVARERLRGRLPTWVVTNWGSDVSLFGRLAKHAERVRAVLSSCDYYSCECERDVRLARELGLKGKVLPLVPAAGGFDLKRIAQFRQPGPTSSRRLILLKGYQGWAGRALVGLRAIELCAEKLQGYRVAVFSASEEVEIAAELVSQSTGIPIEVVPPCSHEDILRLFGSARVYLGLSISDGVPASMLEAIAMGAFPIQSCTACADEWIKDGKTGLIVPPEDDRAVAAAILRAVSDDALVDRAAEENARLAEERLDRSVIQPQVVAMYEQIAAALAAGATKKREVGSKTKHRARPLGDPKRQ